MDRYTLMFVASQFLLVGVATKIIGLFYEKRRTSVKTLLLSLLAVYASSVLLHFLTRNHLLAHEWLGGLGDLHFIVGCLVISLNYQSTWLRRIAATCATFIIVMLSLLPMVVLGQLVFPNLPLGSAEWIAVTNLGLIPIAYGLAVCIGRFKHISKTTAFPRVALIAPLSAVCAVLMFLGAGVATLLGVYITGEMFLLAFFVYLVLMVFSSFVLFDMLSAKYEEKLLAERQAQEKEYYYTQCQLMQESATQVKAVRHDIKLHLASLKSLTASGSMGDIDDYLENLLDDIEQSEIYSDTGNIAFDSVINYKLRNAKNADISLELNLAVPPTLSVEMADIVTILGNLLDNATQAVAKVTQRIIKLDIKFNKGTLFIKIENTFNGEIKYSESGAESDIISLKHGDEHGYGLKNIKQALEKYNGHMKISHTQSVFSVGVFLYVNA